MLVNEFKQRVLEQQIFDELKDSALINSRVFKNKYEGADIDYTRLYRRIVNYQIKTYGCTLSNDIDINGYKKPFKQRWKQRKYSKKRNRGLR